MMPNQVQLMIYDLPPLGHACMSKLLSIEALQKLKEARKKGRA